MKHQNSLPAAHGLLILALCLVMLCLTACSMAPKYQSPDAILPKAAPSSWQASTNAGENALNAVWWQGFGSSALPLLQQTALAKNYNFAANGWQLSQAMDQVRVAKASFFPWASMEVKHLRKGAHGGPNDQFSMTDIASGSFQASYEVDVWGRIRSQADSASFMAEASLYDWRAVGLSLESDVALAYFTLLAQEERLQVQKEVLKAAEGMLEYLQKQQSAGAASPLNIARQSSDVAAMRARVEELERLAKTARNTLSNLLGSTDLPEALIEAMQKDRLTSLTPPVVPVGLPSELLTRRPDIMAAEATLKSANANIGVARAAFLPSITLTVQGGWQSSALESLFDPGQTFYNLAAGLVAPIFQGGRIAAQHDIALARKEEMVARYQQTTLAAFLEVDSTIAASAFLAAEETNRAEAARQATEAYRLVRVRYAEGAETFLAVLDAQRTMLSTHDALVMVRLTRLNSAASLFKALGGGWSEVLPENLGS